MEKTDKRLFALAATLILLLIAWFAQFSRAQQNITNTGSMIQIFDATGAKHIDVMNEKGKPGSRLAQGGG